MKTFKVTYYDYWNPGSTRKTVHVEAMSPRIAEQMIRNDHLIAQMNQADHARMGTAIVFVSTKEVQRKVV